MDNREYVQRASARAILVLIALFSAVILVLGTIAFTQFMDSSTQSGVKADIVSNVITACFFTLLGIVVVVGTLFFERQRLFRFFGISNDRTNLHIYVSRLEVQEKGAKGTETVTKGYMGPAITVPEYRAALRVAGLFRSKVLALLPEGVRWLFSGISIKLSDIEPKIDVSPVDEWNAEKRDPAHLNNIVVIGSGVYNQVAKYYLDKRTLYYFAKDKDTGTRKLKVRAHEEVTQRGRTLLKAAAVGDVPDSGKDAPYPQRDPDGDPSRGQQLGIIECIHDGATVYVCSGVGTWATFGAVTYLVERWSDLQHEFRGRDFVVVLGWSGDPDEMSPEKRDVGGSTFCRRAEIKRTLQAADQAPGAAARRGGRRRARTPVAVGSLA